MNLTNLAENLLSGSTGASRSLSAFLKSPINRRISYLIASIITLFNVKTIDLFVEITGVEVNFQHYHYYNSILFGIALLLFAITIVIGIRKMQKMQALNPVAESSMIKGPLAFLEKDELIFKSLQRNQEIAAITNAVFSAKYRIGILTASSGSGKTSILNAGIIPALRRHGRIVVSITLTNQKPMVTLSDALNRAIPSDMVSAYKTIEEKINWLTNANKNQLSLIFDQFEQFYTHQHSKKDKKAFTDQLKDIYLKMPEVDMLLAVRSDFLDSCNELMEIMGFVLDVNFNYFKLKKLNPNQSSKIFKTIAANENLFFEEDDFDEEFFSKRLASAEDGLISPVDLQILLMMIGVHHQGNSKLTKKLFEKWGGVNQMLRRYIDEQLNTPNTFNQNNAILNVLVTLIDKDKEVRSGRLTVEEISENVPGEISITKIGQILLSLENARIIRSIGNNPVRYELAHELLISSILEIYQFDKTNPSRISNLLEKRNYEWVNNLRHKSYLLGIWDLYKINRVLNKISWGNNEILKKEYITKSKNYLMLKGAVASVIILFFLGAYCITQTGWYTCRYKISDYLVQNIEGSHYKYSVYEEIAALDTSIIQEVASKLKDPLAKSRALTFASRVLINKDLAKAISLANQVSDKSDRCEALLFIAKTIRAKKPEVFKKLITDIYTIAKNDLNDAGNYDYDSVAFHLYPIAPKEGLQLVKEVIRIDNKRGLVDSLAIAMIPVDIRLTEKLMKEEISGIVHLEYIQSRLAMYLVALQPKKAFRVANELKAEEFRDPIYRSLGMNSDDATEIIKYASLIEDKEQEWAMLYNKSLSLAKKNIQGAILISKKLDIPSQQYLQVTFVPEILKNGMLQEAIRMTDDITQPSYSSRCYAYIGAQVFARDSVMGNKFFYKAFQMANLAQDRPLVLTHLAEQVSYRNISLLEKIFKSIPGEYHYADVAKVVSEIAKRDDKKAVDFIFEALGIWDRSKIFMFYPEKINRSEFRFLYRMAPHLSPVEDGYQARAQIAFCIAPLNERFAFRVVDQIKMNDVKNYTISKILRKIADKNLSRAMSLLNARKPRNAERLRIYSNMFYHISDSLVISNKDSFRRIIKQLENYDPEESYLTLTRDRLLYKIYLGMGELTSAIAIVNKSSFASEVKLAYYLELLSKKKLENGQRNKQLDYEQLIRTGTRYYF